MRWFYECSDQILSISYTSGGICTMVSGAERRWKQWIANLYKGCGNNIPITFPSTLQHLCLVFPSGSFPSWSLQVESHFAWSGQTSASSNDTSGCIRRDWSRTWMVNCFNRWLQQHRRRWLFCVNANELPCTEKMHLISSQDSFSLYRNRNRLL